MSDKPLTKSQTAAAVAEANGLTKKQAADLLAKATVFVDDRGAAADEAGELILAARSGDWSFGAVAGDLTELCLGTTGRTSDDEITLFKSVGLAVWDLIVADTVVHTN